MAEPKLNLEVSGLIIGFLGVLAILFPLITGISLSIIFGILLILGGVIHVAQVFSTPRWSGSIIQFILAAIYLVAGLGIITNPVLGLTTLTLLLFIYLIFKGLGEALMGLQLRHEDYAFGIVLSGLVSLLLGWLIWIGWPSTASWAVGVLFGASLISTGISLIIYGNASQEA